MNLLLDTHVALWAITDSPRLSTDARELLQSPRATLWISTVSLWEIAIKHSLGRGDMPISGEQAWRWFQAAGYRALPVEPEHALAVEQLPPYHQDPFDRLLVAQARIEPMRLLTHDATLTRYGEMVVRI